MNPQQRARNPQHTLNVSAVEYNRPCSKPVLESYCHLANEGTFADFIVGKKRKRVTCHRLVLQAKSPVFKVMLSDRWNPDKGKEIRLEGVDPMAFEMFLEFIYTGTLGAGNVSEALELLQLAHMYDVPLLFSKCVDLIENEMALENVTTVLQAAWLYDNRQLMERAGDLLARSMYELSKAEILDLFVQMGKLSLIEILKRNDLQIKEVDLFRIVLDWAERPSDLPKQQCLQDILPYIRFPIMTPTEIQKFFVPENLLNELTLSTLCSYFHADIETRKILARTLMFDIRRRLSPDLMASVSLYLGDVASRNTRRNQFPELKECLQFHTLVHYLATPPSKGRSCDSDHAMKTTVGLNGISIYCPANATYLTALGDSFTASFKEFKITVKVKDCWDDCDLSCDEHYQDLLSLSHVTVEEGKITDIEFGTAIHVEQGKFYCITVDEIVTVTNAEERHRCQVYDVKNFGSIPEWVFADVGNKRVNIQDIQRNKLFSYGTKWRQQPRLICKLGLEELL